MLMNQHFFLSKKFQSIMFLEKNEKKIFPEKTEYSENRSISETFFSESFLYKLM